MDPAEAENLSDSTTSVWSLAGDTYGDNLGSMFIRNGSATTATFNLNNPTLIPLKFEFLGACGNTQSEVEANLLLREVTFELNGQRVPDSKFNVQNYRSQDSTNADYLCQDHFVILSNWEKDSTYTLKYTANTKKELKWGDQVIPVGTFTSEFIISTP